MKNNTNQIMKLNIPIWIKYWLLKHKNASYILSEILTGTEFFLQDSAPKKFKKFIPIGRTTQESTTGKNLFDKDNITKHKYVNDVGDILNSNNLNITQKIPVSVGEEYIISGLISIPNISSNISFWNGNTFISRTTFSTLSKTFTIPNDCDNIIITVWDTDLSKVQLEQGSTATDYEPYTGGEPAPNPIYPYAIKNTGDNGSVNEKVQNKNFIYDANHNKGTSITQDGITYTVNDDGSISVNGTATANGTYYIIGGNGSQPLTLKPGNYVLSGGISGDAWIRMFDGTNYYDTGSSTIKSFTLNDEINIWVGLRIKSGTTINATFYPQLEIGSTPTSYVPHSEQNISFPLSQGQKLYQDEELKENGKDDIWSEVIFDGTETGWSVYNSNNNRTVFQISVPSIENYSVEIVIPNILSTHFIARNQAVTWKLGDISRVKNTDKIIITMQPNMTITEWKTWLAQQYSNGTPVTVVYKKAEPTITPYTEGQQQYYDEHIKPLRTYKNVTHISSEDETPANLRIQYYKEG